MNIIKSNRRARQSGTTLVELSVVIAVILLLVGVLFMGVTAWKNSANRAACFINLASLQKAVRSYQNSISDNATLTAAGYTMATVTTAPYNYLQTAPTCPLTGGAYVVNVTAGTFPAVGTAAFTCPNAAAAAGGHTPGNTSNW